MDRGAWQAIIHGQRSLAGYNQWTEEPAGSNPWTEEPAGYNPWTEEPAGYNPWGCKELDMTE